MAVQHRPNRVDLDEQIVKIGRGQVRVHAVDTAQRLRGRRRGQQAVRPRVVGLSELDQIAEDAIEDLGNRIVAGGLGGRSGVEAPETAEMQVRVGQ